MLSKNCIGFLSGSLGPEFLILLVSDHLKMIRIDTQAIVALVVDLLLARNKAIVVDEGYNVNCHCLPVKAHTRVATTSACA